MLWPYYATDTLGPGSGLPHAVKMQSLHKVRSPAAIKRIFVQFTAQNLQISIDTKKFHPRAQDAHRPTLPKLGVLQ